MKFSWIRNLVVLLGILFVLTACGAGGDQNAGSASDESNDSGESEGQDKYKVGVTQLVEHPSLNAAFEGFQQALEDAGLDIDYDMQNAQNDNSANMTIANNLVSAGVDLIFANSTPSAQAAASATQEIPIIFTSVTDAVSAELVSSVEEPGGNLTGTVDSHPDAIPNTMKFLQEELGANTVGMVYNAGEQNSVAQVNAVKEVLDEFNMTLEEAAVSSSAEVKQATESLVGKVDAIYIITDNTVVSALETVASVAKEHDIPLMTAELDSVERGAFAAYGFEYYDIGYEAGEMAVKILTGEQEPADLPVQNPQNLKFIINEETANELGIEIKDEWNAEFNE